MSALKQMAQGIRNMWGHAEDDDVYDQDDVDEPGTPPAQYREASSHRQEKYAVGSAASQHVQHGGGSGSHLSKLRPVANPLRSSREKNIYTLRPKSMDEVSLAADYLKTGCAVILNLEAVEKLVAVRIIDFMSGVCYGLDNQGHTMKLGDTIFLFTPGDYEINSDETDYGENEGPIFKDVSNPVSMPAVAPPVMPVAPTASGYITGERRSWDR